MYKFSRRIDCLTACDRRRSSSASVAVCTVLVLYSVSVYECSMCCSAMGKIIAQRSTWINSWKCDENTECKNKKNCSENVSIAQFERERREERREAIQSIVLS